MAVLPYQRLLLPLLELAADGQEHTLVGAIESVSDRMQISAADREEMLPSGTQTKFYNRIGWAVTYLSRALVIEKTGGDRFRITDRGRRVLAERPDDLSQAYLERFEEFREFKTKRRDNGDAATAGSSGMSNSDDDSSSDATPHERLEAAHCELREALAEELLQRVRGSPPKFFERRRRPARRDRLRRRPLIARQCRRQEWRRHVAGKHCGHARLGDASERQRALAGGEK